MVWGYLSNKLRVILSIFTVIAVFIALNSNVIAATTAPIKHGKVVTANPVDVTPHLPSGNNGQNYVKGIAQLGLITYIGGSFPSIGGVARTNLAAFNTSTGAIQSFAPKIAGGVIETMTSTDDGKLLIGGTFTSVNGIAKPGIAKLNTNGTLDNGFNPSLSLQSGYSKMGVYHIVSRGYYTYISGSFSKKLLMINTVNGADIGKINLNISGSLGSLAGIPKVERFALSQDSTKLVGIGNFTAVNGKSLPSIFKLDLAPTTPVVSNWHSSYFKAPSCSASLQYILRDVKFNPSGDAFAVVTTGGATTQGSGRLCDTASYWSTSSESATSQPRWINYSGDSLYAVEITDKAVYVGGHQRWLNNPYPNGDYPGKCVGTVCPSEAWGLGAIDPISGLAIGWNPVRDAKGHGVEVLMANPTGLWFGGDAVGPGNVGCKTPNAVGNCRGQTLEKHAGVGFFPLQ
jgi:hypothetical protein